MPIYFPKISLKQVQKQIKPSAGAAEFSLRANSKDDVVLSVRTADNKLVHLPVEFEAQTNNYFVRPPEHGTTFQNTLPKIFNKPIQEHQLVDVIRNHAATPGRQTWYQPDVQNGRATPALPNNKTGLRSSLALPFGKAKNLSSKVKSAIQSKVKTLIEKPSKQTATAKILSSNFRARAVQDPVLSAYKPSEGIWNAGQPAPRATPDNLYAKPPERSDPFERSLPSLGTRVKSRE